MGEQHHSYTGLLLVGFALLVLLTAIFFTLAQTRVTSTNEFKAGNSKLKAANNWLIAAYVLSYIATGVGVVLAILYFGHVTWGVGSETIHAILFILLFLHIILSGIFGFVALSDIQNSGVTNSNLNNAKNWIWAGEVTALLAIIVIVISGAWRAHYASTKAQKEKMMSQVAKPIAPPPAQFEFTAPSTIVTGSAASPPPPPPHSAPYWENDNNAVDV